MYWLLFVLLIGVVFVNGWTDAPNAITCIVSTGAMPYRRAVRLAAVWNLLGLLVMSLVNSSVAQTITGMVRLDPTRPGQAMAVLCAAMLAIVLFSVGAWYFGIPTSESHALVAGLTGAALAQQGWGGVNAAAWSRVLWGLGLSLVLGFGLGWMVTRLLGRVLCHAGSRFLDMAQIASGAGMAFMHGAQDGQKFVAVFVLAGCLSKGVLPGETVSLQQHLPLLLLCAVLMALGTLVGGGRIIDCVGSRMVQLQKYQGTCADIGGALCLLLASLLGIPMSTTHTKTTAIMGAGVAASGTKVDRSIIAGMLTAWLVTLPACGMLGYVLSGWLLRIIS